mgnify:FL=1
MGCKACASGGGCGTKSGVAGCKNNGSCGTGGCNKMNVFDWLGNMDIPSLERYDVMEVRFKNGKKDFFRNVDRLDLVTGDGVVVEVQNGYHLGYVSLQGELVRIQMMKRKVIDDENIHPVLRLATERDWDKFEQTQARNLPTLYRTREIIQDLGLKMKLSDVEFQADNSKATFYYSADERVDFRELIKVLASEFKIRVEMKQISLRQEAGRLGGIGSCGRELCCSTWLSDFRSVSTSAARYQNLSLNPSKLSGQCGRLKCCLNYELETYMDALEHIPTLSAPLKTKKGLAQLQKTDIFKCIMWFGFQGETVWHPLTVEQVNNVLELNQQGVIPEDLKSIEGGAEQVELEEVEVAPEPEYNVDLSLPTESVKRLNGKSKKQHKNRQHSRRNRKHRRNK